jgi:hypothetical protein
MATSGEITFVREKTNTFSNEPYSDEAIGVKIDETGDVFLAIADIWRSKAAKYADLVNVSEAGASQALSDLQAKALQQAAYWEEQGGVTPTVPVPSIGPAEVSVIRRTS